MDELLHRIETGPEEAPQTRLVEVTQGAKDAAAAASAMAGPPGATEFSRRPSTTHHHYPAEWPSAA